MNIIELVIAEKKKKEIHETSFIELNDSSLLEISFHS